MKLQKYEKLKQRLEVLKLEKNFSSLNTTLYWFSFLGNAFLIWFGYHFIKTITDQLPNLFPFQDYFFVIFIALFLTGYELTKRFVIEQTSIAVVTLKRATSGVIIGTIASLGLIIGSFYLSLNGAHRLVDSSQTIVSTTDSLLSVKSDSIAKYYDQEIAFYRSQTSKSRQDRKYRDSLVSDLQSKKEEKLKQVESKTEKSASVYSEKNKENDTAFLFMTFFLEIIIVLGVGFNAYYTIGSYQETGKLLQTPKYKQYVTNLKLLKIYFNNGKKNVGDIALPINKLISISKSQKLQVTASEIKDFVNLCGELEIVEVTRSKRRQYAMTYDEAKLVMERDESL